MSNKYQLDKIDRKILSFLVKNARMPFLEIARECEVSGAAIHQRVRKMESQGIIAGSRLLVKPSALGFDVCAFVGVILSESKRYDEVLNAIRKVPEVVECHYVTGKYTLLLKIFCEDHDHLMNVLVHSIQNIPGIQKTDTMISLDNPIDRQVWLEDFVNS